MKTIDIDSAAESALSRLTAPDDSEAATPTEPEDTQVDSETLEVTDEPDDVDAGTVPDDGQLEEPEDTSDEDAVDDEDEADAPRPDTEEIPEDAEDLDPEATYVVTIDGEQVALTGDEIRNGYLRHDDYTRKRQAESAKLTEAQQQVEQLQAEVEEAAAAREQLQQAEDWYQERAANPTAWASEVLAEAAQGDPARTTAYLGKTIMDLAEAGLVTPEFARHFKLEVPDNPVRKAAGEGELTQRLDRVETDLSARQRAEQERQQQQEQQQALIDEYKAQWERVKDIGGLDFETSDAEAKTRAELAQFALDNEVDDLVTAFLLMERDKVSAASSAATDKMDTDGGARGKRKAAQTAAVNRSSTRSTRAKPAPAKTVDEAADRALKKLLAKSR